MPIPPGLSRCVGLTLTLVAAVVAVSCHRSPSAARLEADNPIRPPASPPQGMQEFFAEVPEPDPVRVRLGRWLFFDTRLSADHSVSCATCHRPEYAFADIAPVSSGVGGHRGRRKTPSLVNLASRTILLPAHDPGPAFFWDGRATSLEAQVLMPIADPREMGLAHPAMLARLAGISGYVRYFQDAFGSTQITSDAVAASLAEYVRTRMSGNAAFDRWEFGRNPGALTAEARLGYEVFSFKGRCAVCHSGFEFSDGQFHNLGVGWNPATRRFDDEGRAAVTGRSTDTGRFKTPRLRDVGKHPPYMHDGSIASLRDVVEFYNRGGTPNPWQTARLRRPLELTSDEIEALVAFLRALDGEGYADPGPTLFPR